MKPRRPQQDGRRTHDTRPRPPRDTRPAADAALERIHGFRAGLAVLAARPADVERIACVSEIADEVRATFGAHASTVGVGILADHEVERLAGTKQHEGLVLEARARRWASPKDLADLLVESRGVAIALDRVRNSYNIGAILRTAAFFGVDAAILGAPAPHPGLDANAIRVAEGGVEAITMSRTTDLADSLSRLRARGVRIVGADGHAATNAFEYDFTAPAVLVMGNEREGLGPRVRSQCDGIVAIVGSGRVESLNVAVAAGVLVSQLTKSRGASTRKAR